jgi:hypothetical protein
MEAVQRPEDKMKAVVGDLTKAAHKYRIFGISLGGK